MNSQSKIFIFISTLKYLDLILNFINLSTCTCISHTHVPNTSHTHPTHIPNTSHTHPTHIPNTSHTHPKHNPYTSYTYLTHVLYTTHTRAVHIPYTYLFEPLHQQQCTSSFRTYSSILRQADSCLIHNRCRKSLQNARA